MRFQTAADFGKLLLEQVCSRCEGLLALCPVLLLSRVRALFLPHFHYKLESGIDPALSLCIPSRLCVLYAGRSASRAGCQTERRGVACISAALCGSTHVATRPR